MKTNTQFQKAGLPSRSEQLRTNKTGFDATRRAPRIDFTRRRANRTLSTERLLDLLRAEAPRFLEIAEVVGKWVWIQFEDRQPPDVTRTLAKFGFHWNRARRTWQHPCGIYRGQSFPGDPRRIYGSYFPADLKAA